MDQIVSIVEVTTISGLTQVWLARDEIVMLTAYRAVRQQGRGTLFLDMNQGQVTKFDVRPDVGSPQVLNQALGKGKLRD